MDVCVFCASSNEIPERYYAIARELGREMVQRGIGLVYGGGNNGLMGALAREISGLGGRITGVIPIALKNLGYAYDGADEVIITDGLRERKAVMEERADGFVGLPGGFGTIEEMVEIVTLRQLRMLAKPIVFLNSGGFYDGLLSQFETGYRERFIPCDSRELYLVTESGTDALEYIVKNAFRKGSSECSDGFPE